MKKYLLVFSVFISLIFLTACQDPQQEALLKEKINNANNALSQAKSIEMPIYAPEEYQTALSFYDQGKTQLEKEQYPEANNSYDNLMSTLATGTEKTMKIKANNKTKMDSETTAKETEQARLKAEEDARLAQMQAEKEAALEKQKQEAESKKITYYTVEKNDCLWNIAKKKEVFGNAYDWGKIFNANKDIIKNPRVIYPGQKLKIVK